MRRILVTGGVGFIGSCFVRRLMRTQPDAEIYVVDAVTYAGNPANLPEEVWESPRFFFYRADVRDRSVIERLVAHVDAVVHFAAETHVDNSIYNTDDFIDTDVKGTQVLLDAVRDRSVERFIHISTSEVYGTALTAPMTEDHPLNPRSPYASAKCGADRLVYSYVATFDVPAVIIRPFNNYGPHQHVEKVIPCFITHALQELALPMHGDGTSSRDWLFVEDCCEGIERALTAPLASVRGEVFNLATGVDTSIGVIGREVLARTGRPHVPVQTVPDRKGQVSRHIGAWAKANAVFGWRPRTALQDGLQATIDWYARNEAWWRENTHKQGGAWLSERPAAERRFSSSVQAAMARSSATL
jgi:dTDP-glucose 4,6-dehydratase